jgi:uroporphyrinogen decarboxylase
MMFGDEPTWHRLLERLADITPRRCGPRSARGASAVQLFDSWAGRAAPDDYERYVLPHSAASWTGWPTSRSRASTSASAPASCSG